MGNELTHETITHELIENIPIWLDGPTCELVRDIVRTLAQREHDLLAVILFGSVARQDERPLTDKSPSDVDLLAIFDTDDDPVVSPRGRDITHTIGLARNRRLDAPRDVQVMFATRSLCEWDETFISNIQQDGILLWVRNGDPLPAPLAAIGKRQAPTPKTGNAGKQTSVV